MNLGVIEATRGATGEADRSFQSALLADPENALALTNLAVLREKAGDGSAALALYERALAIDPTDETARRKVAELKAPPEPPPQAPLQAPQPPRSKP